MSKPMDASIASPGKSLLTAGKCAAVFFAALFVLAASARAMSPVETKAEFALIMDYATGAVLFEKNADQPTAPASMSKLMTVAIVFEKLKSGELSLDDPFSVSVKAWRMQGSKMWVREGTEIPLADLLRGVIIQSGNDACIVIAENIAGSEDAFAELMTRKAREWGMTNSSFANASGWPHPDHKMSMRDLGILARKIIKDYPDYYALFSEREFTWEKIRQSNRNPLLKAFDGADGLKTGHTDESGYGVVGAAVKDGVRRIVILNGLESDKERTREARRMMLIAFNDFEERTLFEAGDIVADAAVFGGKAPAVPLITRDTVSVIAHRSALDNIKATFVYRGPVAAPVQEAQQIGYLTVTQATGEKRDYPLFAGRRVSETGAIGRIAIAAQRLFGKPERGDNAEASVAR